MIKGTYGPTTTREQKMHLALLQQRPDPEIKVNDQLSRATKLINWKND